MCKSTILLLAACLILSAAEPTIVTLDRSSVPLTLDVVFKGAVTSGDCEITVPQNLQAQPQDHRRRILPTIPAST